MQFFGRKRGRGPSWKKQKTVPTSSSRYIPVHNVYIMCVLVCFFEGTPVSFTHTISTVHQHHHISSFRSKSFGLYLRPLLFSKSEENWKQVCQCHQNVGSFLAVRVLVKMSRKSRWMYEQHEHWYDAEGLLEGILTNVDLFRSRSLF